MADEMSGHEASVHARIQQLRTEGKIAGQAFEIVSSEFGRTWPTNEYMDNAIARFYPDSEERCSECHGSREEPGRRLVPFSSSDHDGPEFTTCKNDFHNNKEV